MGHRGSFAVVKDGRTQLYRSQWGGYYLTSVFFYGPDDGLDYVNHMEEVDYLLDDVWCEGAAILDLDRNRLTFFQTDMRFRPEIRLILLKLMSYTWPSWEVRWASGDVAEVATLLGIDPALVRDDESTSSFLKSPPEFLDPPDYIISLLTVRDRGGLRDHCLQDCPQYLLWLGPELVVILDRRTPSTWTLGGLIEDLEGGATLDPVGKVLEVWFQTPTDEEFVERIRRRWPGWTVLRHDEGLPGQLQRSGRDPSLGRVGEEEALRQIVAILFEDDPFDPAEFLGHLSSHGEEVQWVHPGFLKADRPGGDRDRKLAILGRAISEYRSS